MKPEQFADYFENPGKLDASSVAAFEEIIREYPFCQPAQLLYLKGLQNDENIRFNRQLKIAAAYAADRKILFELLHIPKNAGGESDVQPGVQEIIPPPVTQAVLEPQQIREPQKDPEENDKPDLVRQVEQFLPIADIDLLLFDFPAYTNDGLPEVPAEDQAPGFLVEGDNHYLEEDDDSLVEKELLQQFLEMDPLSRRKPPEQAVRPVGINRDIPVSHNWSLRKSPADDLIDRFIENPQPKVLRPDHAPVKEQDVSLSSQNEDDEFLTETLARIYVQQGYYLKAIQAYEKLSLKIPEKSVYFASQIDMVRELIKNQ